MRHMLNAMGKRDAGSDAPAGDFFLLNNMNCQYHQPERPVVFLYSFLGGDPDISL